MTMSHSLQASDSVIVYCSDTCTQEHQMTTMGEFWYDGCLFIYTRVD